MKSILLSFLLAAGLFAQIDTVFSKLTARHENAFVTIGYIHNNNTEAIVYFVAGSADSTNWLVAPVMASYVLQGVRFLGDRFLVYGYEITTSSRITTTPGRVLYSKSGRVLSGKLDTSWHATYASNFSITLCGSGWLYCRPFPFYEMRILPSKKLFIARGPIKYDSVVSPDSFGYAYSQDSCRTWLAYTAPVGQTDWKAASDSWVAPPIAAELRPALAVARLDARGCFDILGRRVSTTTASSIYFVNHKRRIYVR